MKKNIHGGGATTNTNGLAFEKTTEINDLLKNLGCQISTDGEVTLNGKIIGYSTPKYSFYKNFLEPRGIEYKKYNKVRYLPDDLFINEQLKTAYVIEKKFQATSGSVDEKLPSAKFKQCQYQKLLTPLGYSVKFMYLLSPWFKQERYDDIKNYLDDIDILYFIEKLPVSALGL